jgi:prepilin-type N-terminal cleavage/methylation domain-containing protein
MPATHAGWHLLQVHRLDAREDGFTLIEIAISLAIIGLMIGGVLKGQEMITNTRIKKMERDNAGIAIALHSYQDRYRQMPGDDDSASTRFSMYGDGMNDPLPADIDGDGDGAIDGAWMGAANTETANVWKHLRAANLIPGNGDDDSRPGNTFNGHIGVRDGSLQIAGPVVIFSLIDGNVARILEARLDDNKPSSGRIQSDLTAALMDGSAVSSAGSSYADTARYYMAISI